MKLLLEALAEWGVGGKTSAGCGRLAPFGPTPFVCLSLARYLEAEEIEILATREAEDDLEEAVRTALAGANPPHAPRVCFHPIHSGESDAELWRQFDVIKNCLRAPEGTDVALDITRPNAW